MVLEVLEEPAKPVRRIKRIGVGLGDYGATRGLGARRARMDYSALRAGEHAHPEASSDGNGIVLGAIVNDDDLEETVAEVLGLKGTQALGQEVPLVISGDDDADQGLPDGENVLCQATGLPCVPGLLAPPMG